MLRRDRKNAVQEREICGSYADMHDRSFGAALGELIRRKRKAAGLTQTQLAEDAFQRSGLTRRISELETGAVADPHPKTINPLIVALGITDAELDECAKGTGYRPDADLDQAYREARNLIEAIAKQFEHANPDASLGQLDDFLRLKAKEWRALRQRIELIDAPDERLSNLKSAAIGALSQGDFDAVDSLLSQAEEVQQQSRTLEEVRRQANIRIMRGDTYLLRGNTEEARRAYLAAAGFFRPFDEGEMVELLELIAAEMYEAGRRALLPSFLIATSLLEVALETSWIRDRPIREAKINYRLALIYRNTSELADDDEAIRYLDKAISHSKLARIDPVDRESRYDLFCTSMALANCLFQKGKRLKSESLIDEGVKILSDVNIELTTTGEFPVLLAHASNGVGSALMEKYNLVDGDGAAALVEQALDAFRGAVDSSERAVVTDVWSTAKVNIGRLLWLKSKRYADNAEEAEFMRIQSISAYLSALEMFPADLFPLQCAEAHNGLAAVLVGHAETVEPALAEVYLARAIGSYEAASNVWTEVRHPWSWARIQSALGAAFAMHAGLEGVETVREDYKRAEQHFREALRAFEKAKSPLDVQGCEGALEIIRARLGEITTSTS